MLKAPCTRASQARILSVWEIEEKMAGVPGIEPGMTGSKPVALPLGYTPT